MPTPETTTSSHRSAGPVPRRPARRRRRWVGWTVVLVVLAGLVGAGVYAYRALDVALLMPSCTATASGASVSFTPEQTANAALIAGISAERGLPPRAATIAIATAIQESKLRNLTYGDRDSIGLFQQRPSQGWGTRDQILDPIFSTNRFYDALVKVNGWESMEITKVAQAVQRSGFPEAYADHEQEGRVLASTLRGYSPASLGCDLKPVDQVADATAVKAHLAAQTGVTAAQNGAVLTVEATSPEQAWMVGHWAAARADAYGIDRVQVGDRVWVRGSHAGSGSGWSSGQTLPSGGSANTTTIRLGSVQA